MYKKLFLILFLGLNSGLALAARSDDCLSLMRTLMTSANKKESIHLIKNNWSLRDRKLFVDHARTLGFSNANIKTMIESLNMQKDPASFARVKNYLTYVLSLSEKEQPVALLDLAQLDAHEINSKHIKKFIVHEKKLTETTTTKKFNLAEEKRYQELYYGCRALRPNEVNKNAARNFKNFNLSLNLGTLGASYAFYNMDKDIDAEWFKKLGFDIGSTILFSYIGGHVQTKATDTQIVKSLKSYFLGRAIGTVDIFVYDPMFNKEHEKAEVRVAELKKNPEYQKEVEKLLKIYKERSLYRQYKEKLMNTLRNLPEGISLGVKGQSVDENNVDWNNLTHADLERPEVQDVLVAASMAQVYHEGKGQWIDTDDTGLDRYAFNAIFYGAQIPKSIVQNFITYRMLCMGQDNAKLSFTKAVIFNVAANFLVNQVLFGYREKAINQ
jgi:DNA-binding transcriptional MerR regulator